MYEEGIPCESVEVGPAGRPVAFDADGNVVEVTLNDEGHAVAFDAHGNQIEIRACEETPGEFYAIITRRNDAEIAGTIDRLVDQVWYNRHLVWKEEVLTGKERKGCPKIWNTALQQERELSKKYGDASLHPENDFELGMISGKLSALRWVLGENWDFLDT